MIKKSLCTWLLQYRKLQVMFKVSSASFQTFIDTPSCVLKNRVQYSTVHLPNVICDGHLQIISCVYCNHQVHRDFLITLDNAPRLLWRSRNLKKTESQFVSLSILLRGTVVRRSFNPLNPELNPICYLLALLGAHHFLHVSRIRVKSLTLRQLMLCIYGAPILDVSISHTTTHYSR